MFKGHTEVLDAMAFIKQRPACIDRSVDMHAVRGREDFFSGKIRIEETADFRSLLFSSSPEVFFRKAYGQVRAEGIMEMDGLEVLLIQQIAMMADLSAVCLPGGNRIVLSIYIYGVQDGIPEFLLGNFRIFFFREYLYCPARIRQSKDGPLSLGSHRIGLIRCHCLPAGFGDAAGLCFINPGHDARHRTDDMQESCFAFLGFFHSGKLIFRDFRQECFFAIEQIDAFGIFICPVHPYFTSPAAICFFHAEMGKVRMRDRTRNHQQLALLHIDASLNRQAGIISQRLLIRHVRLPPRADSDRPSS